MLYHFTPLVLRKELVPNYVILLIFLSHVKQSFNSIQRFTYNVMTKSSKLRPECKKVKEMEKNDNSLREGKKEKFTKEGNE